jgi:hypothetical protein
VGLTDSGVWVDLSELHQSLGMFGSSLAGSWAGRARLGPRWRPVGPVGLPLHPGQDRLDRQLCPVGQRQRPARAATCRFVADCKEFGRRL